ncbi:Lacal_2735 family protein [Aequorivita echinoideorum]|uniref:Lacal_2735 family protein n=1 Tax=Aequorivita echinoideorum TaxID=1549647 RepID=A0ABS5S5L4_9FLAO|nr:Lacal_2735 family protein [Aequorivita echinoideorum]MBT0608268.1 Lacal_2735 family protein [Aequorivita echinoideorum]
MGNWFKNKSKLEQLKERYTQLMKKSYNLSLNHPEKSEKVHKEADRIFREIKMLSFNSSEG